MKKVDIVRLKLKGVSNEEIKELIELEALAEDSEDEDPAEEDPAEEDPKAEESIPSKTPAEESEGENNIPPDGIEEAKKEIEELKKKLAAAQKANSQKDVSGAAASKDTDQDIFNKAVASFM